MILLYILISHILPIFAQEDYDIFMSGYTSNAVEIKFFRCNLIQWDGNTEKFKTLVADAANKFCSTRIDQCCLIQWDNNTQFHPDKVVFSPDYPIEEYVYLKVQFVLLYNPLSVLDHFKPSDRCHFTPRVVQKDTLEDIIKSAEQNLSESIGWQVVMPWNDDPIEKAMNMILVPVGLVLLILLIICVKFLSAWQKEKDKSEYWNRYNKKAIQYKARHSVDPPKAPVLDPKKLVAADGQSVYTVAAQAEAEDIPEAPKTVAVLANQDQIPTSSSIVSGTSNQTETTIAVTDEEDQPEIEQDEPVKQTEQRFTGRITRNESALEEDVREDLTTEETENSLQRELSFRAAIQSKPKHRKLKSNFKRKGHKQLSRNDSVDELLDF